MRKRGSRYDVSVGESAERMDRVFCLPLGQQPTTTKIADREEFKALQQFLSLSISRVNSERVSRENRRGARNGRRTLKRPHAISSGLKDFETVRRDKEYELFYIRNEEGNPYFNTELLRNIKLTVDLESQDDTFEEDPLLKVRSMQDRDLQSSANQILGTAIMAIEDYFKIAKKLQDNDLAQMLNMPIMALFLCGESSQLTANTSRKSCLQYFHDF